LLLACPLLALLSVVLALVWFFIDMQLGYFAPGLLGFLALGAYVLCVGRRSVLLLLAVFAGAGLFIETALSAWFLDGAYYRFQFHAEHWPVGAAYILFVFAFSQWLNAQASNTARDYGAVLSLWALRFALLVAFILSYQLPWEEAIKATWSAQSVLWTAVGGLCGAALLCAWRAGCLRVVAALALGLVAMVAAIASSDNTYHAFAWQVLANLAVVALGIGLIRRGVHHGESHAFFLGVATVLLLALLRYADLIGDYIGTAVLFVVIAVVLLGAARFWQSRQATGGEA